MSICDLLPDLVECTDFAKYNEYRSQLYEIFLDTFVNHSVIWDGKVVAVNTAPEEDGLMKGFTHITGRKYSKSKKRYPDFRRSERILWIKPMIEASIDICPSCVDNLLCDGVKIWTRPFKNQLRTVFLLEEQSYVVIIEERPHHYQLITAFYIDDDNEMNDFLNSYDKYKN